MGRLFLFVVIADGHYKSDYVCYYSKQRQYFYNAHSAHPLARERLNRLAALYSTHTHIIAQLISFVKYSFIAVFIKKDPIRGHQSIIHYSLFIIRSSLFIIIIINSIFYILNFNLHTIKYGMNNAE